MSSFCDPMDCSPPGSSVRGTEAGRNTGVGCHFLLQRIFWTQGLNLVSSTAGSLLPLQVNSLLTEPPGELGYYLNVIKPFRKKKKANLDLD